MSNLRFRRGARILPLEMTKRTRRAALIAGSIIVLAIAGWKWWEGQNSAVPEGFAQGNGRLEATEVDIATKLAGRLSVVSFKEGDTVEADQVVARMDTADLDAQLRQARAELARAVEGKRYAAAVIKQRQSELRLAGKELARSRALYESENISREELERDQTTVHTGRAALAAAKARLADATASIEAASAAVRRVETLIEDSMLAAPIGGRVLYRLAEDGEVLPSGGKVLTIIDLSDVYMSIYLPATVAGRVTIGTDSVIILDAAPDVRIPAKVSFVAPKAQFTPKTVETQTEREKLQFRVKVRIAPELLRKHAARVKTGLPGVAYVKLDPDTPWPEHLEPKVPD